MCVSFWSTHSLGRSVDEGCEDVCVCVSGQSFPYDYQLMMVVMAVERM